MKMNLYQIRRSAVVGVALAILLGYVLIRSLSGRHEEYDECNEIQKNRLRHLSETCGTMTSTGEIQVPILDDWLKHAWTVMVLKEEKAVFCLVPKVASSYWKYKLLFERDVVRMQDFGGRDTYQADKPLQDVLARHGIYSLASYPSDEAKQILDTYHKVLFSRHPLERLFSAYRSKMTMEDGVNKYYTDLASKIAERFNNQTGRKRLPNLEQFAEYIISESPSEYDLHWKRIVDVCNPCGISYDYVGKIETMNRDADCVTDDLGMKPWFPKPAEMRISSHVDYAVLPVEIRRKLKKIYKADLELFWYTNV